MNKKKLFWIIGGGILALTVVGEVALRVTLGMADAPLYDESNEWEYMAKPNQYGYRFGNRYYYNAYRQRSEEPDSTKRIVLGLGDSVLFGGVLTDQDSTSSYVFNRLMPGWQMLNISAGSWGPDNCAAYLKHYGTFHAEAIVLLVSSHDAHDVMDFVPTVGVHPAYPKEKYWSAWAELIERYVWPKTLGKFFARNQPADDPDAMVLKSIDGTGICKGSGMLNPGFDALKAIADSADIPLLILLHPDKKELKQKAYNAQGMEIVDWCKRHHIPLVKELERGITPDMYRDGIHTNVAGQRFQAELMAEAIKQMKP